MDDQAKQYRDNAKTCRRLADATKDPEQKANWLMIAAEWNRLADAVPSGKTRRELAAR